MVNSLTKDLKSKVKTKVIENRRGTKSSQVENWIKTEDRKIKPTKELTDRKICKHNTGSKTD